MICGQCAGEAADVRRPFQRPQGDHRVCPPPEREVLRQRLQTRELLLATPSHSVLFLRSHSSLISWAPARQPLSPDSIGGFRKRAQVCPCVGKWQGYTHTTHTHTSPTLSQVKFYRIQIWFFWILFSFGGDMRTRIHLFHGHVTWMQNLSRLCTGAETANVSSDITSQITYNRWGLVTLSKKIPGAHIELAEMWACIWTLLSVLASHLLSSPSSSCTSRFCPPPSVSTSLLSAAPRLNAVVFLPQCPYGQVNVKDPAKRKAYNSLFYA